MGTTSRFIFANPLSRALDPNHPDAEGSDGELPSHLHAGVCQLCLNSACGGHVDTSDEAPFQCRGPIARLYRVRPNREPRTPLLKGNHYLRLRNPRQL